MGVAEAVIIEKLCGLGIPRPGQGFAPMLFQAVQDFQRPPGVIIARYNAADFFFNLFGE